MKLSIKAMAMTSAVVWGGAVLTVGVANIIRPKYGKEFLRVVASIYPGYHARPTLGNVAIGTAYGVVDGAVGGALCAWLYNCFVADFQAAGFSHREKHLHRGPEVETAS
jgi:hypothetical protein